MEEWTYRQKMEHDMKLLSEVKDNYDLVNNLFILCDKYLYIYGTDGKLKDSRQHAYSNGVMKVRNKRAYDLEVLRLAAASAVMRYISAKRTRYMSA